MGDEEAAIRLSYNGRKQQLAVEERLLEIKIQAAIIQARAAGLGDEAADLAKYLQLVRQGFQQAMSDLSKLEQLELESARAAARERRAAEEEKRRESDKTHKQNMDQIRKEQSAASGGGGGTSSAGGGYSGGLGGGVGAAPIESAGNRLLGGVAAGITQAGDIAGRLLNSSATAVSDAIFKGIKRAQDAANGGENAFFGKPVERVVKIDFAANGKQVSVAANAGDEEALLGLLKDAQGTAA
jgi:hypothetical protein